MGESSSLLCGSGRRNTRLPSSRRSPGARGSGGGDPSGPAKKYGRNYGEGAPRNALGRINTGAANAVNSGWGKRSGNAADSNVKKVEIPIWENSGARSPGQTGRLKPTALRMTRLRHQTSPFPPLRRTKRVGFREGLQAAHRGLRQ